MIKNFKITQKLLLGVILQIILIGALTFDMFFLSHKLKGISGSVKEDTEKTETTKQITLQIKDFINDNISYNELNKIISEMRNSIPEEIQNIITKDLKKIAELKNNNLEIENQVMQITDKSLNISNYFIETMSKKLADRRQQNQVSTLERLVIGGALINTNNNYNLKVLFLKMKEDISAKEELLSKVSDFNLQTEKDIQRLRNTPFMQMAIESSEANKKTLELTNQFINNSEQITKLSNEIFDSTEKIYDELNNHNIENINSTFTNIKKSLTRIFNLLIVISLILIVLNFSLAKIISLVFKSLNIDLAKISKGDLAFKIPPDFLKRRDEIGDLSRSLEKLLISLKNIIGNIREGANNVANASQQISSSSQQLSQGANEQAASVEEVSSTMEEISSNIDQNSSNAQITEQISQKAQAGIQDVSDGAGKSLDATKKIADKIQIINDIAFQTNILALNAAVEAARAGEHGKGFAVVAAEVRKLAERSRLAAEDIVKLAMESYTLAEGAEEKMKETLPEVDNTTRLVQEISAASLEQSNGVGQVNSAIQQLNSVTLQNAASSEELATSSEELASQAESLNDLVAFFKVDENELINNTHNKTESLSAPVSKTQKVDNSNKNLNSPNINPGTKNVSIKRSLSMDDADFENF